MSQPTDSSHAKNSEVAATVPLRPMGFADILDSMFSLYRNHFKLFVSICSVYFVWKFITYLLIGITAVLAPGSGQFSMSMLIAAVLSLIARVVMLVVKGGLIFGSTQAFLGKRITASAAFKQAKQRFLPYLGSNLLYGTVVRLFTITLIGVPLAFFFGIRWIFYSLAAVFEEKPAVSALKRSSELVKGGWWHVFGMMLGITLLVSVVQSIPTFSLSFFEGFEYGKTVDEDLLDEVIQGNEGLPEMLGRMYLSILWSMLGFITVPKLATWGGFVSYVFRRCFSLAISCLMLPVGVIGVTLVYFDRRIRKEGFDIEMMVARKLD